MLSRYPGPDPGRPPRPGRAAQSRDTPDRAGAGRAGQAGAGGALGRAPGDFEPRGHSVPGHGGAAAAPAAAGERRTAGAGVRAAGAVPAAGRAREPGRAAGRQPGGGAVSADGQGRNRAGGTRAGVGGIPRAQARVPILRVRWENSPKEADPCGCPGAGRGPVQRWQCELSQGTGALPWTPAGAVLPARRATAGNSLTWRELERNGTEASCTEGSEQSTSVMANSLKGTALPRCLLRICANEQTTSTRASSVLPKVLPPSFQELCCWALEAHAF